MNHELCIADNVKEFIEKHLKDDVNRLALAKFPEDIDREFVIRQIHARQVLSKKLPSWAENDELVFPKKLSLEQCSSELTAKYKSSLAKGKTLIDLTGGMGVDTAFLSDNFNKTYYVEMQEELCEIAKHNFKVLNKNIEVVNDNAEHFITICDDVDCVYLDPARRDEYGRKMVSLHDCSPDVVELHDILLEKAKRILIKVSPMLDIEMVKKELIDISEIHVVAVRNECKEILIEIQKFRNSETQNFETSINVIATDLREGWNFAFTENEELEAQWTLAENVGKYLYEPGVACMKAGCFKLLSQRYGLDKLHRNSHLYTSDELVIDFPGRIFEVLNVVPFDKKAKKNIWTLDLEDAKTQRHKDAKKGSESLSLCDSVTLKKASVAVRNFPLSAEELKKNLDMHDGSDFYIFGTTMKGDKKVVILTEKV
ncbi:MAG: SAM-dependent methyltransferase [Bacteroidales bacterium]|nr:SAM-dependent methyltransferase [Bacteroidales bacterium]